VGQAGSRCRNGSERERFHARWKPCPAFARMLVLREMEGALTRDRQHHFDSHRTVKVHANPPRPRERLQTSPRGSRKKGDPPWLGKSRSCCTRILMANLIATCGRIRAAPGRLAPACVLALESRIPSPSLRVRSSTNDSSWVASRFEAIARSSLPPCAPASSHGPPGRPQRLISPWESRGR